MGQGIGNLLAGFLGGFTGSGATACAVANIQAGGRNRISGISTAFFLLLFILVGSPVIEQIPLAALIGVMFIVVIGTFEWSSFRIIGKVPRSDALMGLTAFYDLLFSVSLGLIISAIYFMKKMADQVEDDSNQSKLELMIYELIDTFDDAENFKDEIFIKHIKGPLFFGSTSDFQQLIKQIPSSASTIIIRMDRMEYIDQSGLYALEDSIVELTKDGKIVLVVEYEEP